MASRRAFSRDTRSWSLAACGLVMGASAPAPGAFTPAPAPAGSVAVFADIDGDGNPDLVLGGGVVHLNKMGDGNFVKVPATGCTLGGTPVVADFDNDGKLDIFLVDDTPGLCLGKGDGTFVESPAAAPESRWKGVHHKGSGIAYAGAAADLDGDGWLDVYLTNYEDNYYPENPAKIVFFPDRALRNDGTGKLVEIFEAPRDRTFPARGVTIGDYDGDGDPDVYVSNYRLAPNILWENDGVGNLADVAEARGALDPRFGTTSFTGYLPDGSTFKYPGRAHTISSAWGDLDNDGDLDLVQGNFAHPGQPPVSVLLNGVAGSGAFARVASTGITQQESYASVALADYDNDGFLDLFITAVYPKDRGRLYRGNGDGTFANVTSPEGLSMQQQGYALAWADVNGDGALDLYLGGVQADHLFLGAPNGNHWVKLRLRGGSGVNGAAIGARVTVRAGGASYLREIQAGGSGGDKGASDLTVHVGLGGYAGDLGVEVRWPGKRGRICNYAGPSDTVLDIVFDPSSAACGGGGSADGGDAGGPADGGTEDSGGDGSGGGGGGGGAEGGGAGCGCTLGGSGAGPGGASLLLLALVALLHQRRVRSRGWRRPAAILAGLACCLGACSGGQSSSGHPPGQDAARETAGPDMAPDSPAVDRAIDAPADAPSSDLLPEGPPAEGPPADGAPEGGAGCSPSSCPGGCCAGTTCLTATTAGMCGAGGAACRNCGANTVCTAGACACHTTHQDCDKDLGSFLGNGCETAAGSSCTRDKGDTCADPVVVTLTGSSATVSASTVGMKHDYDGPASCCKTMVDAVYEVAVPAGKRLTAAIVTGWGGSRCISTQKSCPDGSLLGGYTCGDGTPLKSSWSFPGGGTAYIFLWTAKGKVFDLEISTADL